MLAGSSLFVDTADNAVGSEPGDMVSIGDRVLFTAAEAETGRELWVSDGTITGTERLADIHPGQLSTEIENYVVIDDVAFFLAFDGEKQNVWRSDGTPEGTREFFELPETGRKELASWQGDVLLFSDGLHVLDPESAETTPFDRDATSFSTNGSEIYYVRSVSGGSEVWHADGMRTVRLLESELAGQIGDGHFSDAAAVISIGFSDEDGISSGGWYRSDGTGSGTYLLDETFPNASRVSVATATADGIYFNVEQDDEHATYFGDGSSAGTTRMQNSFEFYPSRAVELEDELVIDTNVNDIYTFDKLTGETELLLDGGYVRSHLGSHEGGAFIRATSGDPVIYYYLDGNLEQVADFSSDATQIQTRSPMLPFGDDQLLLTTWWPDVGEEPAAVDASAKSRELLTPIGTGRTSNASFDAVYQDSYIVSRGRVTESGEILPPPDLEFFGATRLGDRILGRQTGFNDNSAAALSPNWEVAELSPDIATSFFYAYTTADDRAYFAASSEEFGTELWVTDGTSEGTRRVTDINSGEADSLALGRYVGTFGNQAIFYTDRNGEAGDLWISDGRNTRKLLERDHTTLYQFGLFNGKEVNHHFVFTMRDTDNVFRLWRTDGTARGTVPFPGTESLSVDSQITQLGDSVYIIAYDGEHSRLYRTDGTSELEVVDTAPATDRFGSATVLNGKLFYRRVRFNSNGVYQATSVKTFDGVKRRLVMTTAGTPTFSRLRGRTVISVSSGPTEERGLYLSDGTGAGTAKVADQYGTNFGEVGSVNLFMATDPVAGREPHELTLDAGVSFRQTDQLSFSELGEISLPVILLARPDQNVTVRVSVSDSSEAIVRSEDLVFTPDNWSENQFAIIAGSNDKKSDGDQSITVRAEVVNSGTDYRGELIKTLAVVTDVSAEPTLDDDGNLTINGSDGDDEIGIEQVNGNIDVEINGASFRFDAEDVVKVTVTSGDGSDRIENSTALPNFIESGAGDDTILTGDGRDTVYAGADDDVVRTGKGRDVVNAGFGDDSVQAGNGGDKVLGGRGKDTLNGGGGSDVIDGGSSNDVLIGASGSDKMNGQSGADLLLGGSGKDELLGGTGRDILVGGDGLDSLRGGNDADIIISDHVDHSVTRLQDVLAEWRSSRNYDQRIANILGDGEGDRENGEVFLRPGTEVSRDTAADALFGGPGKDWFFAVLDEPKDRLDTELLSEL